MQRKLTDVVKRFCGRSLFTKDPVGAQKLAEVAGSCHGRAENWRKLTETLSTAQKVV